MESITVTQSFQTDNSMAEKFTKTEIESNLEIGFWSGKGAVWLIARIFLKYDGNTKFLSYDILSSIRT